MTWIVYPDRPNFKAYYPTLVEARKDAIKWLSANRKYDSVKFFKTANSRKSNGEVIYRHLESMGDKYYWKYKSKTYGNVTLSLLMNGKVM